MNKQLIETLHLVVAGVIAVSKILVWVGVDHPPVAPTFNYYLIIVPVQSHAFTQRFGEERLAAQLRSM